MTRKFDQLLNIIRKSRRGYSARPTDGTERKEGRVSKYGIDPANLEGGEHNISPELDPEDYRNLPNTEEEDESTFNLPFFKDMYTKRGKLKKEPEDTDLADIETSPRSERTPLSEPDYSDETESSSDLKARRQKYRDGFKMMGRDEE